MSDKKISIIIPAYNEEGNVGIIYGRVKGVMGRTGYGHEIIFVNDGSTDGTKKAILDLADHSDDVRLISFTKNFGHQFALIAGYNHCKGDAAITMDCDLQHPPELIPEMIGRWEKGYEIVNAVRVDKKQKKFLKRQASRYFYRLFSMLSGIPVEAGSADFRLTDRKVVDRINGLKEHEIFLRGMFHWLGYKATSINYTPNDRFWGAPKYSFRKLIALAISGITSFSVVPLKMVTIIGFIVSAMALTYMLYSIYSAVFMRVAATGWTSIMLSVLFLGGIQLISIGFLGEYVGKIFIEVKNRPRYVVELIK